MAKSKKQPTVKVRHEEFDRAKKLLTMLPSFPCGYCMSLLVEQLLATFVRDNLKEADQATRVEVGRWMAEYAKHLRNNVR